MCKIYAEFRAQEREPAAQLDLLSRRAMPDDPEFDIQKGGSMVKTAFSSPDGDV